jgi:transcriptional regulator with XRE-family HTH domain
MPEGERPPAETFFSQVGIALKVFRERAGLSAAELARRCGMGKSQLSKYENGSELPRIESLARILDALGADPLWFFYSVHQLHRVPRSADEILQELAAQGSRPTEAQATEQELGVQRVMDSLLDLYKLMLAARLPRPERRSGKP